MISAKDISNRRFEKAAFGYKQEEVDEFLKELVTELTMMQKERNDIESKLQILADKVREYRQDEDALKDALLGAQKQGHRVIAEAQEKAESILNDAEAKSANMIEEAEQKYENAVERNQAAIEKEREVLLKTQREVTEFKKTLFDMYKIHLEMISALPEIDEEIEEEQENNQPDESVESEAYSNKEEVKDPFAATTTFSAQRFSSTNNAGSYESKFGELQFGQNNK
ncbi:MAG: DivIVA domain-containing protein [Clostridiales bacterium]|nr:DivIVA domain-containing protein [Clostridiales bacterium]